MSATDVPQFRSFAEFWPFYVREHSVRWNRRLHWLGTFLGLCLALRALTTGPVYLILLAPFIGYGFSWVGHFFVQKNVPATFKYPVYSFMGDFRMFALMALGKMDREIVNAFDRKRLRQEKQA